MGTHFHASVTAVVGLPAHAPAERGCAPSQRAVSWGCPYVLQPPVLWEMISSRKMQQTAGNDNVLTHYGYVPEPELLDD